MEYVVDFQAFQRSPNTLVVKEVAIIALEVDACPRVYHFQPPCEWMKLQPHERSTNAWLEDNFHGIPWSSGVIPYESHANVLREALQDARRVFVKGLEKEEWLERILIDICAVVNLDNLDCPSIKTLSKNYLIICGNHPLCWDAVCAVKQASAIRDWIINYKKERTPTNSDGNFEGYDEVDDALMER